MDKNKLIGVLLLVGALGLLFLGPRQKPPPPRPLPSTAGASSGENGDATTPPPEPGGISAAAPLEPGQPLNLSETRRSSDSLFAPLAPVHGDEEFTTLGNEFIEVRFTNYGGAIANVALKKHRRTLDAEDPLVLNAEHHAPVLAFTGLAGVDFGTRYDRVSATADTVVYRTLVQDRLEITRTFRISRDPAQQDPYVVHNETTLRNVGAGAVNLPSRLSVSLGTSRLVHDTDQPATLQTGRFNGEDANFMQRTSLDESSGFLGMFGAHPARPYLEDIGPTVWATVENQFFALVVTPEKPGDGVAMRRVELPLHGGELRPQYGLAAEMLLASENIAPAESRALRFDLYAGPKEYQRLAGLGQQQDKIMQWGWFGIFSKMLLWLMTRLHNLFAASAWAWGFAIIGTTLIVRTLMWPITAAGARSAKRMAKIQGPLKEIQEKYKDNRGKQQEETLKLFKEHKVNPIGGCLPVFIQLPIFFGLFSMLRSASELRFAEFLWIKDMSAPDTVLGPVPGIVLPILGPLALNIMPLLMGASMVVQMRMTPTPTTDNAAARMMKFMPYMVTVFCYNFSSGLAVYWTASNLFTIFQQWVTNRRKDPIEATPAPTKPGAVERAKPVRDAKVSTVGKGKKKR